MGGTMAPKIKSQVFGGGARRAAIAKKKSRTASGAFTRQTLASAQKIYEPRLERMFLTEDAGARRDIVTSWDPAWFERLVRNHKLEDESDDEESRCEIPYQFYEGPSDTDEPWDGGSWDSCFAEIFESG